VAVYHRAPEEYPLIDATEAVELSADWATSPLGQTSARLATILRSVRRAVGRSDSGLEALIVEQLVRLRDADAPTVENLVRGLDDAGLSHALNGQLDRSEQFQALDLLRQRYGPGSPNGHITLLDYAALMRGAGQVRLSTLHAGKGLEFEAVLILALDEGVLPRTYRATPASLAEDRRKFYVALTRARRRLHLFYSGSHVIPDGRVLNEGPSRFLADIGL
jgi:DNA helicase-2/ATP-dependent DNA helicase PcrA